MTLAYVRGLAAAVALTVLASAMTPAEDARIETGFITKNHKNADGTESKYVVFVPHDYDGKSEYPVILFLHGAGETRGGTKMPVEVGIGPAIKKQEKTFPFIVVIPQAESKEKKVGGRWSAASPDGKRAQAILDQTMKDYKTDSRRVYLTGLSMGGMGTWSHAVAHPDRWAAIVPICGRGDPSAVAKIKDIPCWCFHGDADTAVPVSGSRDMIEAIKKVGGNPKYTEYAGVAHNSWDRAYGTKELWTWLLEQRKK